MSSCLSPLSTQPQPPGKKETRNMPTVWHNWSLFSLDHPLMAPLSTTDNKWNCSGGQVSYLPPSPILLRWASRGFPIKTIWRGNCGKETSIVIKGLWPWHHNDQTTNHLEVHWWVCSEAGLGFRGVTVESGVPLLRWRGRVWAPVAQPRVLQHSGSGVSYNLARWASSLDYKCWEFVRTIWECWVWARWPVLI